MPRRSKIVLRGFVLRSDTNVGYPDRYMDERGVEMLNEMMQLLDEIETEGGFSVRIDTEKA